MDKTNPEDIGIDLSHLGTLLEIDYEDKPDSVIVALISDRLHLISHMIDAKTTEQNRIKDAFAEMSEFLSGITVDDTD